MASTDPIDQQSQQLGSDKQNLLAAIAQYGSQAHQAMQGAQDQINAQKQAAINQALADAASRNAPQSELDQVRATVSQPYDQRLTNLTQSDAARQAGFAQQGSAAGNYFGQVQAALPSLRNELAMKVAGLQATAARQQQAQAIALANAQARQAAAAAKAAKPETTSQILSDQFGGLTGFQNMVDQENATLVPNYQADFAGQRGGLNGPGNSVSDAEVGRSYADSIGQAAGMPPGVGAALYAPQQTRDANAATRAANAATKAAGAQNPDTAGAPSQAEINKVKNSPAYKAGLAAAKNAHENGVTDPQKFADVLTQNFAKNFKHPYPVTIDVLKRQFSSGQI